jgi:hypothetical protein
MFSGYVLNRLCRWLLAVAVLCCAPLSSPVFCGCDDCPASQQRHSEHHNHNGNAPAKKCPCGCENAVPGEHHDHDNSTPAEKCQCGCENPLPLSNSPNQILNAVFTDTGRSAEFLPAAAAAGSLYTPAAVPVRQVYIRLRN